MTTIEQKIEEVLAAPLLTSNYNIVRVKLSDNGTARNILQIMIERLDEQPITVSDCQKASKLSAVILDVENFISFSYTLEVSSPGVDRPLIKISDYKKYINHEIRVNTAYAISGRKRFKGLLQAIDAEDNLELLVDQELISVPYSAVNSGSLVGNVNINKKKIS